MDHAQKLHGLVGNAITEVNAWLKWERAEDKNCYAAFEAAGTDYACVVGGRRRYAKVNMIAG